MKNRGAFKTILLKGDFAFTAPNKVNRDHLQLDPVEEAPTLCTESYTLQVSVHLLLLIK